MKKASLLALFLTMFIDLLGFGIVIPLLPFFARDYGASGRIVGAVVAAYSLMQLLFAPLWGRMSDRIGRRPVILISLAGSIIGYLFLAYAHSLAGLLIARCIGGIAAASIGTAQAYVADITTPENRAKGMGLIGAGFGLGFILGPLIGGFLAHAGITRGEASNYFPGIAAAGLSLVALIVASLTLSEPERTQKLLRKFDRGVWLRLLRSPGLRNVYATFFLVITPLASMQITVTLFGRDRFDLSSQQFGYFFGVMGLIVALIQGVAIGPLNRRFGERWLAGFGAIAAGAGFAAVPFVETAGFLYVIAAVVAVGQGLCFPSLSALVTLRASEHDQGSALGISASLNSLSRIVGPPLGGVLYDLGGAPLAFWSGAAILLAASLLAISMRSGVRTSE